MGASHWLLKSEPEVYPFSQLVAEGRATWDGVRNPQARNHLAAMAKGDLVLFYHSHTKEVVGISRVTRTAFPDPTADDERWLAVELEPVRALESAVSLDAIKADRLLATLKLVTQSRLSVMPVEPAQYERILALAREPAKPPTARLGAASPRSRGGSRRSASSAPRR